MIRHQLEMTRGAFADFCHRHYIRRLAVFGSALRDDFRPDSDVDVLVEFEPGRVPGWDFFAMQDELSDLLGRQVDLNTPNFLSPYFRDRVLAEAVDYYVKP
jgi:predicted nucleotidyltransferase